MAGKTTIGDIMHNAIVKTYPDGTVRGIIADKAVFREPGWEVADKWDKQQRSQRQRKDAKAEDLERARRRARAAVADLARANDLPWFVTLTVAPDAADRYDYAAIMRRLRAWLSNMVQRRGLAYVLIAEQHKDGAYHFHGLINDALEMEDSGTVKLPGGIPRRPRSAAQRQQWIDSGGVVCYNMPEYPLGYTTAFRLHGDRDAAIAYVCKYIGKGTQKIGGRWYLQGGALARPERAYVDVDLPDSDPDFTIERLGARCWAVE